MSSTPSRNHPASLVPAAEHHPALLELHDAKVSRNVISYVVDYVVDVVDFAFHRPGPSSKEPTRGRSASRQHSSFAAFATRCITYAEVPLPTLLGALVYLERARRHLQIALAEWAHERVFLGALICASKYLNDSTLKNAHWAQVTGVFGRADVGRIEREFLDVLAFELAVRENDCLPFAADLLALAKPPRAHARGRQPHHLAPIDTSAVGIAPAPAAADPRQRVSPGANTHDGARCPELSPASSSSGASSGSSSPAPPTPETLVDGPPGIVHPALAAAAASASAASAAALKPSAVGAERVARPKKRHSPLDLLRAIGHHHHHHSSSRRTSPVDVPTHPPQSSAIWV